MTTQKTVETDHNTPNDDTLTQAIRTGRMLSTREVATILGYRNRESFRLWTQREKPPVVRLSCRTIRFPARELHVWLRKRSNMEADS